MFISLAQANPHAIRTLRFALGVTFSIVCAFAFNWDFAFLMPILVAKLLGNNKPKMPLKKALAIVLIIALALFIGLIFSRILLPYPISFTLFSALAIFWVCYWRHSGCNEPTVIIVLIAITLLPMLALIHLEVALTFVYGFIFSCIASVITSVFLHELIPDKEDVQVAAETQQSEKTRHEKLVIASMSTLIIVPALVFCLWFDLSNALVILAFITILALNPETTRSLKGSVGILTGNILGGVIALIIYSLLTVAPHLTFLAILFFLTSLLLGRFICSDHQLAPILGISMTSIIILIAMASLTYSDVDEKFIIRVLQLTLACLYVVFATIAMQVFNTSEFLSNRLARN